MQRFRSTFAALLLGAAALTSRAPTAGAQGGGVGNEQALSIRAGRRDTIVAATTVTAAFTVRSRRSDTVVVRSRVELPKDWTVLTGGTPFDVPPNSSEMLMLSVVVPSRAVAGVYPVRVWATSAADPRGVVDSVLVRVAPRRVLDIGLLDRPGYVVSGRSYQTSFLVRNRGNIAGQVRLTAKSALSTVVMSDTLFQLGADESRVVRVASTTRSGLSAATDDVLEIAAFQTGSDEPANASARITVVPEPSRKIEAFQRLPTRVHLRTASTDGVSPFEVFGNGRLVDGGSVGLEFMLRGSTGHYSAFGERDEYRATLYAPSWRARVGDQLFMLSSLTGSGQPGFGVGADGTLGMFSAGAYGQEFRRSPEGGSESGAFLSLAPRHDAGLTLNVVNRAGGSLPGRIASGIASFDRELYGAIVELARSQDGSGGGSGFAHTARVHLGVPDFSFDVGHRDADQTFAGSQRGAEHLYTTGYARVSDAVSFNASGSRQEADLSRSTGVPYVERFDLGSISTTLFERFMLEAGTVRRAATVDGTTQSGTQRTLRGRTDVFLPFAMMTLDVEAGRATAAAAPDARLFTEASIGLRQTRRFGSLGTYVERYSGGGVTKGIDPTITIGGDATLRLRGVMHLSLMGYGTRIRRPPPNSGWHSQLDARLSYTMPNGNSISARTRLMGGGALEQRDRAVAYLEYGMPLALPVSRLRTPGRVYGRVVDATSGQGVPNALVRLGPQVAITDRSGQVAFGGVPAGEHRLSMSQETSFANAVFVGDPTLMVDSLRASPTMFTLAIARSARVDIDVRRFVVARTGVAGAADSLAEAGALANATIMLTGARDTLYRTTSETGKVAFSDVPPGDWVVSIRGDAPAHHRFEPDRLELTLAPGEARDLRFHLVPRRREVQIIGDGQELRSTQAGPKGQAPAPGAKVIKPDEKRKHDR